MHIKRLLALSVTSLIACSASYAASDVSPSQAMNQIRKDHPNLMTVNRAGNIHKILDKELATGRTPLATAENFIDTFAAALDVDAKEFVERGPFQDQHSHQDFMYNRETGQHKFTGVYYMQTADGLPVYESRLMVLVRNITDYPAVSATTVLRDVKGFKKPRNVFASEAIALMSAATRLGKGVIITSPELMVFAGTDVKHHEPTAALVFEATLGGAWDFETYKKLELVIDAQTGEVLLEKNLILHVDGNVSGVATESSGADVCEPESAAGLPYAKVSLGGSTVFADANGDFTISGSGTITSTLDGEWFDSQNQSGSDASLAQSSSDPFFVHNDANDNEQYRAQVNGYLQSNVVRDFTLLYAPSYPTIATQTSFPVKTGVSGTCNAFYDYSSINFYNAGSGCSNTAFSVIVHHEYGHHLVAVAGSGQGQYGEGMGDVMGVLITGDNQLARGFYTDDCANGIRNAVNNKQYPCSGGIHDCGQLISGCVWDTLAEMEAAYPGQGLDIVAELAINSIPMHAGDIIDPSITTDWLTLDDDDGDLTNGTPHSAQILAGFALHNMDEFPPPATYACCIDEVCSELTSADCSNSGGVWRNGYFCNQVSCVPLPNDFCDSSQPITDGTWDLMTLGALSDSDPYNDATCTGTYLGQMHADVWFDYVACETGQMTITTCNLINFDSDIVVYEGSCDAMAQVACNGDADGCAGYSSTVVFNVTAGAMYKIRVGGYDTAAEGSGSISVDGPGAGCVTDPSVEIAYPDGRPSLVNPNGGTIVAIDVTDGTSSPVSGMLHFNSGSGWNTSPLNAAFDATFPEFACGATVNWYISVDSADSETTVSPLGAPSTTWDAMAFTGSDVAFDDDFNTDMGWDVEATAGTGNWERVTPSNGGARCDNPTDADGSGMCYVTGNGVDEDVDTGTTILNSPILDFTDGAILSYSRWYSNGADCGGADSNNDYFYVDISVDGGPWENLETIGPIDQSSGGWYAVEHTLSGEGALRVRFVCGDLNSGSVVEAAVDGVSIKNSFCDETPCTGDINGDSIVDVTDILAVVGAWGTAGGPEDVNGDGIVNVGDLLAIVEGWGSCS
jgi:Zn-dependent metalloprotease